MILTSTTAYIQDNLVNGLLAIISVGIMFRFILQGIKAQEEGKSLSEFWLQSRKTLFAGIISVCLTAFVTVVKNYYL